MTQIEKPSEWFDRVLPETVAQHPEKVDGFAGTLFFDITGESGGTWTVTFSEGNQVDVLAAGDPASAQFTVKMKDTNFVKMMNGEMTGANAFMTGKLKFKGDVSKAMKLRGLLFGG
ncbi:MAG: SCP2 sterol-binding domain-containing protein [Sandaracinaceae bacterium]